MNHKDFNFLFAEREYPAGTDAEGMGLIGFLRERAYHEAALMVKDGMADDDSTKEDAIRRFYGRICEFAKERLE